MAAFVIFVSIAIGLGARRLYLLSKSVEQLAARKVIQAEKFELVAADGKVRATLGIGGDYKAHPELKIFDNAGRGYATLDASGLTIIDQNGKTRAELSLIGENPHLKLYDKDSDSYAWLWLDEGKPDLTLREEGGKGRAWATLSTSALLGLPELSLRSKDASVRLGMGMLDGAPSLFLLAKDTSGDLNTHDGAPSLSLLGKGAWVSLSSSDGEPSLLLQAKDAAASVHLRTDAEGPALDLYDSKEGKERATLGYSELSKLTKPN